MEAGYFTPRLQMQWKKPFHVITSSQLRAVSCYVDKVIKNWIAVFSSGFTRSLLHINSRLSDRDLSTKLSGSIQAEVLERCINSTGFFHPFLDFFATSSVAALSLSISFFLFYSLICKWLVLVVYLLTNPFYLLSSRVVIYLKCWRACYSVFIKILLSLVKLPCCTKENFSLKWSSWVILLRAFWHQIPVILPTAR